METKKEVIETWQEFNSYNKIVHLKEQSETGCFESFFEYDEKGNCILFRNSEGREVNYKYDEKGNWIYSKDNEGNEVWNKYNDKNQLIYSKDSKRYLEEWREYDQNGYESCITIKLLDASTKVQEKYQYDEKGRLVYCKESDDYEYWNTYDEKGNHVTFEHNDGRKELYEYDENNNLIHTKDNKDYETWNEYDEKGNQVSHEDSNGNCYEFKYDDRGYQTYLKFTSSNEITEERRDYDDNGNIVYFKSETTIIVE